MSGEIYYHVHWDLIAVRCSGKYGDHLIWDHTPDLMLGGFGDAMWFDGRVKSHWVKVGEM